MPNNQLSGEDRNQLRDAAALNAQQEVFSRGDSMSLDEQQTMLRNMLLGQGPGKSSFALHILFPFT